MKKNFNLTVSDVAHTTKDNVELLSERQEMIVEMVRINKKKLAIPFFHLINGK